MQNHHLRVMPKREYRIKPVSERFWKYVRKTEGCWFWTGAHDPTGYGRIGAGGKGAPMLLAHRASYEMAYGPIPPGLFVCHTCDNRACVRPDHLFLGTPKDNMDDMQQKGRRVIASLAGDKHPKAKLTPEDVQEILRLSREGVSGTKIARAFGIHHVTVYNIRKGDHWSLR